MSFCPKCGAYMAMDTTVCSACGYDPDAEAKAAEARRLEEEKRKAEEAARRQEEERQKAEAEARRKAEEERRAAAERAEQQRRTQQQSYQHSYSYQRTTYGSGASQTQSNSASGTQGNWQAPWSNGPASYGEKTGTDYRAQASDSVQHQALSILSYFGVLFLIPLLTRPSTDYFARFHANQGLLLTLVWVACLMLSNIENIGFLFLLVGIIYCLLGMIRGIRSVLAGRMDRLPWIGGIRIIK